MTEQEWWETEDPMEMLEVIGDKLSERKLNLIAAAFCWKAAIHYRPVWYFLRLFDFAEGLYSSPEDMLKSLPASEMMPNQDLRAALFSAIYRKDSEAAQVFFEPGPDRPLCFSRKALSRPFDHVISTAIYAASAVATGLATNPEDLVQKEDRVRHAFREQAQIVRNMVGGINREEITQLVKDLGERNTRLRAIGIRAYQMLMPPLPYLYGEWIGHPEFGLHNHRWRKSTIDYLAGLVSVINKEVKHLDWIPRTLTPDEDCYRGFWLVDAILGLD